MNTRLEQSLAHSRVMNITTIFNVRNLQFIILRLLTLILLSELHLALLGGRIAGKI